MLALKILMKHFSSSVSWLLLFSPLLLSSYDYIVVLFYAPLIVLQIEIAFYYYNSLFSIILLVFYLRYHFSKVSWISCLYMLLYYEFFKRFSVMQTYFLFYRFSFDMYCHNIFIIISHIYSFKTISFSFSNISWYVMKLMSLN